jgi:hypothetical protein
VQHMPSQRRWWGILLNHTVPLVVQLTCLEKFILHFSLKGSNKIYFIFVVELARGDAIDDERFDAIHLDNEPDHDVLGAS